MKVGITLDMKELEKSLGSIGISQNELMHIKGAGELVLVNGMRIRVAVDTAATKNSVRGHVVEKSNTRIVDDVGPETEYAPPLEFGIPSKPNYPAQPFIRPTVEEDGDKVQSAVSASFRQLVEGRWQK